MKSIMNENKPNHVNELMLPRSPGIKANEVISDISDDISYLKSHNRSRRQTFEGGNEALNELLNDSISDISFHQTRPDSTSFKSPGSLLQKSQIVESGSKRHPLRSTVKSAKKLPKNLPSLRSKSKVVKSPRGVNFRCLTDHVNDIANFLEGNDEESTQNLDFSLMSNKSLMTHSDRRTTADASSLAQLLSDLNESNVSQTEDSSIKKVLVVNDRRETVDANSLNQLMSNLNDSTASFKSTINERRTTADPLTLAQLMNDLSDSTHSEDNDRRLTADATALTQLMNESDQSTDRFSKQANNRRETVDAGSLAQLITELNDSTQSQNEFSTLANTRRETADAKSLANLINELDDSLLSGHDNHGHDDRRATVNADDLARIMNELNDSIQSTSSSKSNNDNPIQDVISPISSASFHSKNNTSNRLSTDSINSRLSMGMNSPAYSEQNSALSSFSSNRHVTADRAGLEAMINELEDDDNVSLGSSKSLQFSLTSKQLNCATTGRDSIDTVQLLKSVTEIIDVLDNHDNSNISISATKSRRNSVRSKQSNPNSPTACRRSPRLSAKSENGLLSQASNESEKSKANDTVSISQFDELVNDLTSEVSYNLDDSGNNISVDSVNTIDLMANIKDALGESFSSTSSSQFNYDHFNSHDSNLLEEAEDSVSDDVNTHDNNTNVSFPGFTDVQSSHENTLYADNAVAVLLPSQESQGLQSALKSCLLSSRKTTNMNKLLPSSIKKTVIFGSPTAAEFNKASPTTNFTPLDKEKAMTYFPQHYDTAISTIDDDENQQIDELTKENSQILEQWDRLTVIQDESEVFFDLDVSSSVIITSPSKTDDSSSIASNYKRKSTTTKSALRTLNSSSSKKSRRRRSIIPRAVAAADNSPMKVDEREVVDGDDNSGLMQFIQINGPFSASPDSDTRGVIEDDVSVNVQSHHEDEISFTDHLPNNLTELMAKAEAEATVFTKPSMILDNTADSIYSQTNDHTHELEMDLQSLMRRIDYSQHSIVYDTSSNENTSLNHSEVSTDSRRSHQSIQSRSTSASMSAVSADASDISLGTLIGLSPSQIIADTSAPYVSILEDGEIGEDYQGNDEFDEQSTLSEKSFAEVRNTSRNQSNVLSISKSFIENDVSVTVELENYLGDVLSKAVISASPEFAVNVEITEQDDITQKLESNMTDLLYLCYSDDNDGNADPQPASIELIEPCVDDDLEPCVDHSIVSVINCSEPLASTNMHLSSDSPSVALPANVFMRNKPFSELNNDWKSYEEDSIIFNTSISETLESNDRVANVSINDPSSSMISNKTDGHEDKGSTNNDNDAVLTLKQKLKTLNANARMKVLEHCGQTPMPSHRSKSRLSIGYSQSKALGLNRASRASLLPQNNYSVLNDSMNQTIVENDENEESFSENTQTSVDSVDKSVDIVLKKAGLWSKDVIQASTSLTAFISNETFIYANKSPVITRILREILHEATREAEDQLLLTYSDVVVNDLWNNFIHSKLVSNESINSFSAENIDDIVDEELFLSLSYQSLELANFNWMCWEAKLCQIASDNINNESKSLEMKLNDLKAVNDQLEHEIYEEKSTSLGLTDRSHEQSILQSQESQEIETLKASLYETSNQIRLLNRLTYCQVKSYSLALIEVECIFTSHFRVSIEFHLILSKIDRISIDIIEKNNSSSVSSDNKAEKLANLYFATVMASDEPIPGPLSSLALAHVDLLNKLPEVLHKVSGHVANYKLILNWLNKYSVTYGHDENGQISSCWDVKGANVILNGKNLVTLHQIFRFIENQA